MTCVKRLKMYSFLDRQRGDDDDDDNDDDPALAMYAENGRGLRHAWHLRNVQISWKNSTQSSKKKGKSPTLLQTHSHSLEGKTGSGLTDESCVNDRA